MFDDDLRVTFERVVSDSRCPADALCVWAGDAVVRIVLARSTSPSARAELHTAPGFERSASYPGFEVRLVKVLPYPYSSSAIPAQDYRATLVVTPQANAAAP